VEIKFGVGAKGYLAAAKLGTPGSKPYTQTDSSLSMKRLGWNNANFDGISDYLVVFNWFDLLTTNLTIGSHWNWRRLKCLFH